MTDLLDRMLADRDLSVVFQPIFHLSDEPALVAVEALTRGPRGTHFESASVFFDYVRLKHQELAVDRHCIENAIAAAAALPSLPRLSINVHATTLERDDDFPTFLGALCDEYSLDAGSLIVEMVEQSPYWNAPRLLGVLRELRAMGVGIAVDDVGFGHGNFQGSGNDLGSKNIEVARRRLDEEKIPVLAEDLGGNHGRRLVFRTDTGLALTKIV
jgi:EAL domain-containing protein (putative c-di-GMP-specific phosphodiesterase class I)